MAGIGVATLIDDTAGDGSLVYIGYCPTQGDSTDTSLAKFAIKKVVVDTTTTTTAWASTDFDQVWDDRSTLTYE